MDFSSRVLDLDCGREIDRIVSFIRTHVSGTLRRRGVVVGLSGGIDSSVTAALAARAVGKERVLGLLMPERYSSDDSATFALKLARQLGIATVTEDITSTLEGAGCYARQDDAIRTVFADYGQGWKCKITLPPMDGERLNVFRLTVQKPDGTQASERLPHSAYLQLVAATNFKQRVRKMMEYHHADRLNYVVAGTPNRLEHDQGFFVKQGDGMSDIKPIAHLYKTQVYALAAALDVPNEICSRPPTTETYSLPQTQEEFYFALPYPSMDLCLYAVNHGVPAAMVSPVIGMTVEQVERAFTDIHAKRRASTYLHAPPINLL